MGSQAHELIRCANPGGRGRTGWRRPLVTLLMAGAVSLETAPAAAGEELARTEPAALGIGIGGGALALTLAATLLPTPSVCDWCEPTELDVSLHSPWPAASRRDAANYSHLLSFVVVPAGAVLASTLSPLAASEPQRHAFENVAMVTEALVVNLALTTMLKRLVARRRPAFHYDRTTYGEFGLDSGEEFLSFPSGDTSIAFSVASAATTVAFLRGYAAAPYVLAAGATLSTGVALLRVAADVHWPTDVFAGALLGTLVGTGIPLLLHGRRDGERDPVDSGSASLLPTVSPGATGLSYFTTF